MGHPAGPALFGGHQAIASEWQAGRQAGRAAVRMAWVGLQQQLGPSPAFRTAEMHGMESCKQQQHETAVHLGRTERGGILCSR